MNMAIWDRMLKSFENVTDEQKLKELFFDGLDEIASGIATPLATFRDLIAEFDESTARMKDTRGEFFGDLQEKFPGLRNELPDRVSPVDPAPQIKQDPFLRQLTGVTVVQSRTPPADELERLGFRPHELLGRTSEPRWDRQKGDSSLSLDSRT